MELIKLESLTPEKAFSDGGLDVILEKIQKGALSLIPDTTTKKGRDEIKSVAHSVARAKTHLDNLGKELVSGWKEKAKVVDCERKKSRDFLDGLKAEVRQPLTDYEEAEKALVAEIDGRIQALKRDTAGMVAGEIAAVYQEILDTDIDDSFGEFKETAQATYEHSCAMLEAAYNAQKKIEADQAELDRLRDEKAERDAKDAADRKAAEEQKAIDDRKAEDERIAKEAAAKAKAEADQKDKEAKAEDEKRQANKRHVAKVNKEAARFIVGIHGTTEAQAHGIVKAIAAGDVPHISIKY